MNQEEKHPYLTEPCFFKYFGRCWVAIFISTSITVALDAPKAVIFASSKANGIAVLGEPVQFTCNATSLSSSSYEIRHNNVLIRNSTNQVYKIANVSLADEGTYACMAYNYIGYSATSSSNLTIHVPPSLHYHSSDTVVVSANASYHLYCTSIGKPTPQITWYKMERNSFMQINSTSKVLVTNTSLSILESKVVFQNVSRFDGGVYRCCAVNAAGEHAQNVTMNVIYSAIATATFRQNYTIAENLSKNITWLCKIESNPPGRIKWYLDGKVLPSDGFETVEKVLSNTLTGMVLESTLTMIGVRREKAGVLVCNASNSVGFDVERTVIIVNYPPSNVSMLLERYVRQNGSGKFEIFCTFDANPVAEIIWKRNKKTVNSKNINVTEIILSSTVYNTRKKSVLRMDAVERHMQGEYKCIATNQQGISIQRTQLIVHYVPTFLVQLEPILVKNYNEGVVLLCKVQSNPLPQIQWHKNGHRLYNESNAENVENVISQDDYHSVLNSSLYIKALNKRSSRNYTCKFENTAGYKQAEIRIIVQYGPAIRQSFPRKMTVIAATQPVILSCRVDANPRPTVQWLYNGKVYHGNITNSDIEATDARVVVRSTLAFSNGMKRNASGTYACKASNFICSTEMSVKITVWYAPEILSKLTGTRNALMMSNVTFKCKAYGYPEPTIHWYKYGIRLQNVPVNRTALGSKITLVESSLILKEVTRNDAAEYMCEAENVVGRKVQIVVLNVLPRTYTEWSKWGECNVTCGNGHQRKARTCRYQPCVSNDLIRFRSCTKNCGIFFILLYILIPILVLCFSLFAFWLYRKSRRSQDEVPVLASVHDDFSVPQSNTSVQTNSSIGVINRPYMNGTMESGIEARTEKKPKKNTLCITENKVDYERIETEVRFDDDFLDECLTKKDAINDDRTLPSPFSNEGYLELIPLKVAKQSIGACATENFMQHQNELENEAATLL